MSVQANELNTAEVAYAAIDEVFAVVVLVTMMGDGG